MRLRRYIAPAKTVADLNCFWMDLVRGVPIHFSHPVVRVQTE